MAVGVNIVSDFDSRGVQKAIAEFKKLETTSEKVSFGLKKAFLPAVAALSGLAFAGLKAAQAAAQDELEQAKLAQTLEKVVGATSETVASTETMIASMSRASGTADTELREALSKLVVGTGDLARAQKGLALAQDIATATGMPLVSAAQALSLAYSGNYRALQRLSPELKELVKDGATTDEVFKKLNGTFGGATANAADTAAGKMKILKNNITELQESFGQALLPILEKVTEGLIVFFNWVEKHKTTVLVLATAIGVLATAIVAYNIALKVATISQMVFGATAVVAAAAAAPIALIVGLVVLAVAALVAILVIAYQKLEWFRDAVNFVGDALSSFVGWMSRSNEVSNQAVPAYARARGAIKSVGFEAQAAEQKFKNLERAMLGTMRLEVTPEQQLKTQADRYNKMALSMGHYLDFTGKFYKETKSGGGVVESASEKLKKYIDAIKGVTSAQRSLRDANKDVDESNKGLLEKTKALIEAQKRFKMITDGYGKESKQAKDADTERAKAERTLERSKYALEEAIFAIKEAELKLAEVRKDPESTPQMIREAEIRLAQAKLNVADATDNQRESSDALTMAQERLNEAVNGAKEGSDAYSDALAELLSAEKEQSDAINARTTAYERQADAVRDLAEAEQERRDAGKEISAKARARADAQQPSTFDIPQFGGSAIAAVATTFAKGISNIAEQTAVSKGFLTQEQADALFARRATPFAHGGIVTKSMLGLVGERGPEAVIPLDRMGSMGNTINITVNAGMGTDGKDVGTQIVNALKRYERTNGALPLTVA